MNSLFDPECHRQVLGSRQEARNEMEEEGKKEKGRVKRGRGRRRRTGNAGWDRECGGRGSWEASPARTEVPSSWGGAKGW